MTITLRKFPLCSIPTRIAAEPDEVSIALPEGSKVLSAHVEAFRHGEFRRINLLVEVSGAPDTVDRRDFVVLHRYAASYRAPRGKWFERVPSQNTLDNFYFSVYEVKDY